MNDTREQRAERERRNGGGYYGSGIEVMLAFVALVAVVELVTRFLF